VEVQLCPFLATILAGEWVLRKEKIFLLEYQAIED
jgi:hypothetical protein